MVTLYFRDQDDWESGDSVLASDQLARVNSWSKSSLAQIVLEQSIHVGTTFFFFLKFIIFRICFIVVLFFIQPTQYCRTLTLCVIINGCHIIAFFIRVLFLIDL